MARPALTSSLAVTLLFAAPSLAQTPAAPPQPVCSMDCRDVEPVPISGRVLNAVTGVPIPGAVVHYRGMGNVSDGQGHLAAPPSLQGEVVAGADGNYATPPLPSFGDFNLRASAPGFFAAHSRLQALPARLQSETIPTPPGYRRTAKPMYDSVLRLRPDPVGLHPMSDAALANFALPQHYLVSRRFIASAFNADGNRLAFLTEDRLGSPPVGDIVFEGFHRCAAWVYDLTSGVLSSELGLPQRACEVSGPIVWNSDTFYLPLPADFSRRRSRQRP